MAIHQVANVAGKILETKTADAGRVGSTAIERETLPVPTLMPGVALCTVMGT